MDKKKIVRGYIQIETVVKENQTTVKIYVRPRLELMRKGRNSQVRDMTLAFIENKLRDQNAEFNEMPFLG